MKNIHVLPTDKPSRLYLFEERLRLGDLVTVVLKNSGAVNQHIYITSDEKIKGEDWYLNNGHLLKCTELKIRSSCEKIILTTDQDLIKDGVQAIDDEFLEWFVKNPSCEWVDIETMMECEKCGKEHCDNLQCRGYKDIPYYKIIIPKEEPKQEKLEEVKPKDIQRIISSTDAQTASIEIIGLFNKWQQEQERMYSEEDMREAYKYGKIWDTTSFEEWFEKFKNK